MRIIVEYRTAKGDPGPVPVRVRRGGLTLDAPADVAFSVDLSFDPVLIPSPRTQEPGANRFSYSQPLEFSAAPADATYVRRGHLPDDEIVDRAARLVNSDPNILAVYADPVVQTFPVCPGGPAVGTDTDVAAGLGVEVLARAGLDGARVPVAIVDTGINRELLKAKGRTQPLDAKRSWTSPAVAGSPGQHAVGHGTMCAFDVGIAAPRATLLDYAILHQITPDTSGLTSLLSDAIVAYSELRVLLASMPVSRRRLVVSNSWGLYDPGWDFPPGHPGNYSDNPNHPFSRLVGSLEADGADILFAAGNCGRDCPAGPCRFGDTRSITGANSHPRVLSVAGVDIHKERVGYSSQGPGRLSRDKPDLSAYTHFAGSGVLPVDSGTSAACPVAAGVVAAVRTRYPISRLTPAQLRSLLFKTALDVSGTGFDTDYGWGVIDAAALVAALPALPPPRKAAGTKKAAARSPAKKAG